MSVSQGELLPAGYFILIAAAFDFLDGMAARLIKNITEFGKQLDSLADVVSFGVAPAMILFRLFVLSASNDLNNAETIVMSNSAYPFIAFASFLVAVFSALRLAKFNIDPSQSKNFKGLATPANAIFIASLGFIIADNRSTFPSEHLILNPVFLLVITLLSCYLLVCNISMFSLKFSSAGIKKNTVRYVFLILTVLFLILFGIQGLAPAIVAYILLSITNNAVIGME